MQGVIYARYSSDNQREESIEGQLRECKAFAESNDIRIVDTYIDRALSAKTDNRPAFQKMIKDSAKHLFDVVIVWKLYRFARNRFDSAHNKAILRKNGIKVISATERISEGSKDILLESMLEGMAEYYSAELSEKVIRGMTENALKCKYNGGSLPIGYIVDAERHFQIEPLGAKLVNEMFTKYTDGSTIQEIVNIMNDRNIKSGRGGKITINIVNDMLRNRRYIGEFKYRNIVVPDGIPAIISEELFKWVQKRLAKNKKTPARYKAEDRYLLTTKLFCGKFMVGESGTSRTQKVHHYYRCVSTKKKKLCDMKTIKKDLIENAAIYYAMKIVMDDDVVKKLTDKVMELQGRENTIIPLLKKQLADTQKSIDNIIRAIEQGVLTSSTKKRLDELEELKSNLEVSLIQEEMQKPLLTRDQVIFWIHKFRKFDLEQLDHRQRLIDSFINAIYVYDDKVVFTFNYKDGSKTVSMADIEGSDLKGFGAPLQTLVYHQGFVFFVEIFTGRIIGRRMKLHCVCQCFILQMPFLLSRRFYHKNPSAGEIRL